MRFRGLAVVLCALVLAPPAGARAVFLVSGRGWGHGIGMSQWGARGMAERGYRFDRILAHYYPGTRLGPAPMSRVRVLLVAGRKKLRVESRGTYRIVDGKGRRFTVRAGGLNLGPRLLVKLGRKRVRLASPVRFRPGGWALRLGDRPYRGELVVRSRGGRLSAVNELGLERYLRGVVPYEMPHDWPQQALRAQAVVARSYALATLKPGKIYDLLPDQRSQVYGGIEAETRETSEAIGATAGRVLLWNGRVATTFYHSTSGGRTAAVWEVWPDAARAPYLRGVADPFDAGPHHRWGPVVVRSAKLLRGARDLEVERGSSGRATWILVRTRRGDRRVDPSEFRRQLRLQSTWFRVAVLRLDAPRGRAVFGRPLELRGLARGVRGAVIQRRDGRAWHQVARVRPRRDGSFRVLVRPRTAARYRLAAERTPGPAIAVRPSPAVRVLASIRGRVAGRVLPAGLRAEVAIQRRTSAGWKTVTQARTDAGGAFLTKRRLRAGSYRAVVGPAAGFSAGSSRFTVG